MAERLRALVERPAWCPLPLTLTTPHALCSMHSQESRRSLMDSFHCHGVEDDDGCTEHLHLPLFDHRHEATGPFSAGRCSRCLGKPLAGGWLAGRQGS